MIRQWLKILVIISMAGFSSVYGQVYHKEWEDILHGPGGNIGTSIENTTDRGYIVACGSESYWTSPYGGIDYRVIKLRADGTVKWQKTYGGPGSDVAQSIQQTSDLGYIVVGTSSSTTGDVSGNHGGNDIWVLKIDSAGTIQWEKSYGGTADESGASVQQTKDKGYIIGGTTSSANGDVTSNHGGYDYWALKLDSTGLIQWQKTYGGTQTDYICTAHQIKRSGYILAGYTYSNDGDVSGNHGVTDYWLLKLDTLGAVVWKRIYGGSDYDNLESLQPTADSGFVISGNTASHDGIFSTNTNANAFYVLKLDTAGMIQWNNQVPFHLSGSQIRQCRDNSYILSGNSVYIQQGQSGAWTIPVANFLKLDSAANVQWSVVTSWSPFQTPFYQYRIGNICESSDSGYVYTGSTGDDCWVVKLYNGIGTNIINTGIEVNGLENGWIIFPNPMKDLLIIRHEKPMAPVDYEIVDELGRTVLRGNMQGDQYQIITSSLQNGIYTLCIGSSRFKLVKQD